jgi:aminoglycoside phosphotransferase (APT) family kinase protein
VKMHADQAGITASVVAGLVAGQFPQWRDLPVRAVTSHGTVNALFRLGDCLVLRFPLRPSPGPALRAGLIREQDNATRIAAQRPGRPAPGQGPIRAQRPGRERAPHRHRPDR